MMNQLENEIRTYKSGKVVTIKSTVCRSHKNNPENTVKYKIKAGE